MINVLTIKGELMRIYNDIKETFIDIWNSIESFLTQFIPKDVLNVLLFAVLVMIILFVILAIMNRD